MDLGLRQFLVELPWIAVPAKLINARWATADRSSCVAEVGVGRSPMFEVKSLSSLELD
jgi:hypothetical protein